MRDALKKEIRSFIKASDRLVILGIGNPEKGDDAAGPLCADLIKASLDKDLPPHVKIINAGIIPENYTGDIRKFRTTHVLIIDAVIAGEKPGSVFKVNPQRIIDEDISTHRMPLRMLSSFINKSIGAEVFIIGIEPKIVDFDTEISKIAKKSIDILSNLILRSL